MLHQEGRITVEGETKDGNPFSNSTNNTMMMMEESGTVGNSSHTSGVGGVVTELHTAWDVDRRIVLDSADKVVMVRFSSYCCPPDEMVFHDLRTRQDEEKAEAENERNNRKRKHRRESYGSDVDEEDDLLDALNEMEQKHHRHKKSKKRKGEVHHSDSSYGHRIGHEEEHFLSLSTSTSSSNSAPIAGMEHYLATQKMDALLMELAPKVRKFCTIFTVDTTKVTAFNALYELGHDRDPFALMFFYRNTHIKIDVGTGNTNKINFFAFEDWSELLPMVEAVYRAGKLGKHMTSVERQYSTVSLRR